MQQYVCWACHYSVIRTLWHALTMPTPTRLPGRAAHPIVGPAPAPAAGKSAPVPVTRANAPATPTIPVRTAGVTGSTSTGNALNGKLIFGNADGGIASTNGGNGGQPAPVINSAVLDRTSLTVTGSVKRVGDYKGPFQVQVYANPAADAGNVQGRRLLGTVDVTTTDFTAQFPSSATIRGSFITVVATPATGPANTSGFSAPASVL